MNTSTLTPAQQAYLGSHLFNDQEARERINVLEDAWQTWAMTKGENKEAEAGLQSVGLDFTYGACIRAWRTTKGIGQLALEGPQPETQLDEFGMAIAPLSSVLYSILVTPSSTRYKETPENYDAARQVMPHPHNDLGLPTKQRILSIRNKWDLIGEACLIPGFGFRLHNAACLRSWGTSEGLGQIALSGCTSETILDYMGTVDVPFRSVLWSIECVFSKDKDGSYRRDDNGNIITHL